ncbi:TonB-dependent receptor [Bowmanella denitrificans]|uniref:TonB-dependent receptor n=1 Tax=Bowmanella denitrificans TaxID=366582 RepID=A0ABP3GI94_9ALTE
MRFRIKPALLAVSLALSTSTQAQQATTAISFEAQSLESVIATLSRQFDLVIIAPADQTKQIQVQAVREQTSVLAALKKALAHTSLQAVEDNNGAIVIMQKPQKTSRKSTNKPVQDDSLEEVVALGSHIKGARMADTLPMTLLGRDELDIAGVQDGMDLLRMLPQNGDVNFNESATAGGVNTARGDVASLNLRSVGTGNTLMLINGRRMVMHPGFQTENLVPAVTPNMNAIPTAGVRAVEVMRDGASALYGADAVAGVVNTLMVDDFDGLKVTARYGEAPDLERRDSTFRINAGSDFSQGRGHFSVFADYDHRNAVPATNLPQGASSNREPLLAGTDFEGNTSFDNRSSIGGFAYFDMLKPGKILLDDGTAITNSSGRFHVQPFGNKGCLLALGDGLCVDDGFLSSTDDRNLYYDIDANRQLYSDRERANLFSVFSYDLSDKQELFGELGVYYGKTDRLSESSRVLSTARMVIPAHNYWNPFGPKYFADGRLNPNRVEGVQLPDEGLDLILRDYRILDAGQRRGIVKNLTYRALLGTRGNWDNWDYDSAILYSRAVSDDLTKNGVSSTKFQQALSLDTEDAYNPFNGAGNGEGVSVSDLTPNPEHVIRSIQADVRKKGTTSLALADFRLSNNQLYSLPAGPLGFATGVEWRREAFKDDRDDSLDGTSPFIDAITGEYSQSDSLGNSPTNDTSGDRDVWSAFVEMHLPLVSPNMQFPLMQDIQLQLAARYENLSDVGSALTPRVAASWALNDSLMLRGAWSEGFRAPNLVQVNDSGVARINSTVDYVKCAAELEKGIIQGDFSNCGGSNVENVRTASDLKPEDSTSVSYGLVLTPLDGLVITADYWKIKQEGVVGVLSGSNQVALDLFYRQQGSSNPNVEREAPSEELLELYAGTSITPAGAIIRVYDPYQNLDTRTISGMDFALNYDWQTSLGSFGYSLNAARLISFEQLPGSEAQQLFTMGLPVDNLGELAGIDGKPQWKVNSTLKWKQGNWRAGATLEYVSAFDETSASITVDDEIRYWRIEDWYRVNLFSSVQLREFGLDGSSLSVGVKNLFDREAPLADEAYGHFGAVHSPIGRYYYLQYSHSF